MLGEDRIYITDNLNKLKNLKEERDNLRSKLDRILTIQKDSAITVEWIKTQSNLIMGCNNVANSMFITEDNIENILKLNNI
jgi:hypothetical protein